MTGRELQMFLVTALVAVSIGCDLPPEAARAKPYIDEDIPFDKDADPPVCQDAELTSIVDVHEHAVGQEGVEALLAAMPLGGIDRSVAFGMLDTRHTDNYSILEAAQQNGDKLIPFVVVDVTDPNALAWVKAGVAAGARGLKLFSGHGEVHGNIPLDSAFAEPIYDYLEQTGTPLLMHVNGPYYLDELERVLDAHPDLVMVCPHFCLFTSMPGQLARLMDKYPNLSVDISFGNTNAALTGFRQFDANIDAWRRFFRVYVERITFGTDRVYEDSHTQPIDVMYYQAHLGMLQDETFSYLELEFQGLAVDACTLKHILQHNPERFVAGLPPERSP